MNTPSLSQPLPCPTADELRRLLDDALPAATQADLAEHLSHCPRCRLALDRQVADAESWADLPISLRRELSAGPALQRVIDGLKGRVPAERVPELSDLRPYLQPSERPDALGKLGVYDILAEIGRGGMSVVLKAVDPALGRLVAVKVLAPHLASSGAARQRFTREARAVAAVCHEHVVAVHAVDDAGALPFLVMEYVPGKSLQQRLDRDGALPVTEVLRIGYQVASALAAAHAQGLVHRDVKPANILLENGVERVRLGDFGLARAVADAGLTEAGVVAGTPQYMAPEQARGELVDTRADLFSLGSVLYAMCSGRAPFVGDTPLAIVHRVCHDDPPALRGLNPNVPDWLEGIIARLHSREPAQRFASAAAVAELLRSCLAHVQQPTLPLPAALRSQRRPAWSWRRRLVVAVLLFLCAAGLGLWWAWPLLHYKVRGVAYSPDGRWRVEAVNPGGLKLYGRLQASLNDYGWNDNLLAFSPDSRWLATAGPASVFLWDLREVSPTAPIEVTGRVSCLGFARGGKQLVAVTEAGELLLWEFPARVPRAPVRLEYPQPLLGGQKRPRSVRAVLSPDGDTLVWWSHAVDQGRRTPLLVVQSLTTDRKEVIESGEPSVLAAAFTPDGKQLAWGGFGGRVTLVHLDRLKEARTEFGQRGAVYSLAFAPTGKYLAIGNGAHVLTLWDTATQRLLASYRRHWGDVYSVAWSPDGRTIASGGRGRAAHLWDVSEWTRP